MPSVVASLMVVVPVTATAELSTLTSWMPCAPPLAAMLLKVALNVPVVMLSAPPVVLLMRPAVSVFTVAAPTLVPESAKPAASPKSMPWMVLPLLSVTPPLTTALAPLAASSAVLLTVSPVALADELLAALELKAARIGAVVKEDDVVGAVDVAGAPGAIEVKKRIERIVRGAVAAAGGACRRHTTPAARQFRS